MRLCSQTKRSDRRRRCTISGHLYWIGSRSPVVSRGAKTRHALRLIQDHPKGAGQISVYFGPIVDMSRRAESRRSLQVRNLGPISPKRSLRKLRAARRISSSRRAGSSLTPARHTHWRKVERRSFFRATGLHLSSAARHGAKLQVSGPAGAKLRSGNEPHRDVDDSRQ